MSTYKRLNKQDAYITTYTAHKTWAVSGSDLSSYSIDVFNATGSYSSSLVQLYYPSKSLANTISHSFDYYDQTTLYFSQSRNYQPNPLVISIPRELYGTHIHTDKSFKLVLDEYVEEGYWSGSYVESKRYINDDGEGNLYISGSLPRRYVGDIIYSHGLAIITDTKYSSNSVTYIEFKSSQPIFTHNYHCKLRESEFNFTYNPSTLSGSMKTGYDNTGEIYTTPVNISDGVINSRLTGSEFQPYITTVGLYNDANQLIAVGKMSRPVPKSANTDMTITVKIDI